MPIPGKYLADFEEYGIYHVYNRTNNNEKLFLSDKNRYFFLKKYAQFLSCFLDTYCWCLLPNHFHLLVRVKPVDKIISALEIKEYKELSLTEKKFIDRQVTTSEMIEQSFKRFFQCYALSFNKENNRKGNLFYKPFKRIEVNKDTQLTQAIIYIHANPLKHKLVKDFTQYQWSSWQSILSGSPTQLLRSEIIEWFGSKSLFIKTHQEMVSFYYEGDLAIEE